MFKIKEFLMILVGLSSGMLGGCIKELGSDVYHRIEPISELCRAAIMNSDISQVKKLLADGAALNEIDKFGKNIINNIASSGWGFDKDDDDQRLVILRMLIEVGGNPYIKDKKGNNSFDNIQNALIYQSGSKNKGLKNHIISILNQYKFPN